MRSHWFSDGFLHKELFSHPVLQDLKCMNHEVKSLNRWWLVDRSKKKSVTTCHMGIIWSLLATTLPSIVETDGVRATTHRQFTPGRTVCATPWLKHGVAAILEYVSILWKPFRVIQFGKRCFTACSNINYNGWMTRAADKTFPLWFLLFASKCFTLLITWFTLVKFIYISVAPWDNLYDVEHSVGVLSRRSWPLLSLKSEKNNKEAKQSTGTTKAPQESMFTGSLCPAEAVTDPQELSKQAFQ